MTWIKQSDELYINDQTFFSLEKIDGIWYVINNKDNFKSIPFTDIFNNPVFPIDLSNVDLIVKSLVSTGAISGNSLDITNTATAKHFRGEAANTPATPALSFQTDLDTGLYRISDNVVGFSANGARQGEFGVGYGGFTGNIIQAQFGSVSTPINTTNTSFQSTGLNVSITPKYINSKILIFGNCQGVYSSSNYVSLRLVRDGNQIYYIQDLQSSARNSTVGFSFIESPSSISSLNYAIQYKAYSAGTAYFNDWGANNVLSTIIAMEIQQ